MRLRFDDGVEEYGAGWDCGSFVSISWREILLGEQIGCGWGWYSTYSGQFNI